ncbi:MAG: hypothetical protein WKF30_12275, partial [Pyrinomonadaceae bacterium]
MKTYEEDILTLRRPRAETSRHESADESLLDLSIFLPVYNEEPNLPLLQAKLDESLKALGRTTEIIY